MKLRLLAAAAALFALSTGLAVAQSAPAAKPAASAAAPAERSLLGYALGYRLARSLSESNVDVDMAALIRGAQEGYAKKDPSMPTDKLGAALDAFGKKMAEQERALFDKASRENKARSDKFMNDNRAKPGVTVMPSGVQYRVIEPGAKPTAASTVSITLRSSLVDGKPLGDSQGEAVTLKMSEFPPELAGVKEAVLQMTPGARWEIYVPASKAYGDSPRSPIGPNQALVFEVRLVSVK
jgi:FKBP-type peptidyl-prolyl cis-trans isomerase